MCFGLDLYLLHRWRGPIQRFYQRLKSMKSKLKIVGHFATCLSGERGLRVHIIITLPSENNESNSCFLGAVDQGGGHVLDSIHP